MGICAAPPEFGQIPKKCGHLWGSPPTIPPMATFGRVVSSNPIAVWAHEPTEKPECHFSQVGGRETLWPLETKRQLGYNGC